jgi:predicted porin
LPPTGLDGLAPRRNGLQFRTINQEIRDMKRTLRAHLPFLAVLAAPCGGAYAQSSVTVFGVIDATLSGYSSRSDARSPTLAALALRPDRVGVSRTELRNSGYNGSRIGFRGTEDLGGGLAAGFWLEAPVTNDDGQQSIASFARRATVSLSGAFGEVRIGRDYTTTFWNDSAFDPFGVNGVGTTLIYTANIFEPSGAAGGFGANTNYTRIGNSISYFLPPTLGGVYGQFQYAFHERDKFSPGGTTPPGLAANGAVNPGAVASVRAGSYVAGRLGYASGPLDVAISAASFVTGDSYYAGTTDRVRNLNAGASYDFGPVKLFAEYSRSTSVRSHEDFTPLAARRPDVEVQGYSLGLTAPVGPGLIRAAYSAVKYDLGSAPGLAQPQPRAHKIALGYVHNLSKRTALYATVAQVNNRNGAALVVNGPAFINNANYQPRSSRGYDFGIRHAF